MGAPRRFTRLHLLPNWRRIERAAQEPPAVPGVGIPQTEFERTPEALAMEQRAHAILRRLGFDRRTKPGEQEKSVAPLLLFSLESEDPALQRLLDQISFERPLPPPAEIERISRGSPPGKTLRRPHWRAELPRFRPRAWRQVYPFA